MILLSILMMVTFQGFIATYKREIIKFGEVQHFSFDTHYQNYYDSNNTMGFEFHLPPDFKYTDDSQLNFVVRPEDFRSDPDLKIYQNIPGGKKLIESCTHYGIDVCYVFNIYLLQKDLILFVDVTSQHRHCVFSIQVQLELNNNLIEFGKQTHLVLYPPLNDTSQTDCEKLFKVYLPVNPKVHHFTVTCLIEKEQRTSLAHDLHIFVNLGNEPPTTSQTMSWGYQTEYGLIYTCFRGDFCFREGWNYTFLLNAPIKTAINVFPRLDTELAIPVFIDQETLVDAIPMGNSLTYLFNASRLLRDQNGKLKDSLIINLDVSQGNPDLYVNCDSKPNALPDYTWFTNNRGMETLVISKEELDSHNTNCDMIYLTVYARFCAAFAINLHNQQENNNNTYLQILPGISERGYLGKQEMVVYLLALERSQYLNISVRLTASLGNPDLYIKECSYFSGSMSRGIRDIDPDCLINSEYKQLYIMGNKTDKSLVGYSRLVSYNHYTQIGNDQVDFTHNASKMEICSSTSNSYCFYSIIVHSNSNLSSEIHLIYSLAVTINKKSILLKENVPVKSTLLVDLYDYYKFTLIPDPDILAIYFQITPITGDPEFFASRTIQDPGFQTGWEKAACFCVNLITYEKEDLARFPLQKQIFLSVMGLSTTTYTINVHIERNYSNVINSQIVLHDGIAQKAVFLNDRFDIKQEEILQFLINIGDSLTQNDVIHLFISDIQGQIQMVIKRQEDKGDFAIKLLHNSITLQLDDLYNSTGHQVYSGYILFVHKVENQFQTQFTLNYRSQNQIIDLYTGSPVSLQVQRDRIFEFKIEILLNIHEAEFVGILISHTEGQQGVEISLSNLYDVDLSENQIYDSTQGEYQNSIILTLQQLMQICNSGLNKNKKCYIIGEIKLRGDMQVDIQTELKLLKIYNRTQKQSQILQFSTQQFYEDKLHQLIIPSINQVNSTNNTVFQYNVYFKHNGDVKDQSDILVEVDSHKLKGIIKYSILDPSKVGYQPSQWNQPILDNKSLDNLQTQFANINNRYIKRSELCENCIIFLSLYIVNPTNESIIFQLPLVHLLHLQVTNKITSIKLNGPYVASTLIAQQLRTYQFTLDRNKSISIFIEPVVSTKIVVKITSKTTLIETQFIIQKNASMNQDKEYCVDQIFEAGHYLLILEQEQQELLYLNLRVSNNGCQKKLGIVQIRDKQSLDIIINSNKQIVYFDKIYLTSNNVIFRLTSNNFNINKDLNMQIIIISRSMSSCSLANEVAKCNGQKLYRQYQNGIININQTTLDDILCEQNQCHIILTFESSDYQGIIQMYANEEIESSNSVSLILGQEYIDQIKPNQTKLYRIYIIRKVLEQGEQRDDQYIVTLDQIFGLSSFMILSHDQTDIRLSQKTNRHGRYVWAQITIPNNIQAYLNQNYIEIQVNSELFKASTQTSNFSLVVYKKGDVITLAEGNFYVDILEVNQSQEVNILHQINHQNQHYISLSGQSNTFNGSVIIIKSFNNGQIQKETYSIQNPYEVLSLIITLPANINTTVNIKIGFESENPSDIFEYMLFNKKGSTYPYSLQKLQIEDNKNTEFKDTNQIITSVLNSKFNNVIQFKGVQSDFALIQLYQCSSELIIQSEGKYIQYTDQGIKYVIINVNEGSSLQLSSSNSFDQIYKLQAHSLQIRNINSKDVWDIVPEIKMRPLDGEGIKLIQIEDEYYIEFSPFNRELSKNFLTILEGNNQSVYQFTTILTQSSDIYDQCKVIDLLSQNISRKLIGVEDLSFSIILEAKQFNDPPQEKIRQQLDQQILENLAKRNLNQIRFQVYIVGTFRKNLVSQIFPNQDRDVSIYYQPQTFTIYPKTNLSMGKPIPVFEQKSTTLFILALLLMIIMAIYLWRRNKRLRSIIKYEQTTVREQDNNSVMV